MNGCHERAHIRLVDRQQAMEFIQCLGDHDDAFSIESHSGSWRVNAKSLLGVICTILAFPDEMYLVNTTHNGIFPPFVDQYRVLTA